MHHFKGKVDNQSVESTTHICSTLHVIYITMKLERLTKMASIHIHLLLLVLTLFTTTHITQSSWVQTQAHLETQASTPSQNLTKLHFYFNDIVSGPNPTALIIARPENATTVGFGTLVMIDDPLTVGPSPKSRLIGRAQGMYGEASKEDDSLLMAITFSFLEGSYKGSSISVLGRYRVLDAQREMPIVGGSGVFRLARGYALARTYKYNVTTGDATSEYNVFVLHSDTSSMY